MITELTALGKQLGLARNNFRKLENFLTSINSSELDRLKIGEIYRLSTITISECLPLFTNQIDNLYRMKNQNDNDIDFVYSINLLIHKWLFKQSNYLPSSLCSYVHELKNALCWIPIRKLSYDQEYNIIMNFINKPPNNISDLFELRDSSLVLCVIDLFELDNEYFCKGE